MKKNIHFMYTAIILALFSACKDKSSPVVDLLIPDAAYSVGLGLQGSILISSGNKNYTITAADEDIVKTEYLPESFNYGAILISGKKKGSTQITVTDNVNGQEAVVSVTVTDAYFSFGISGARGTAEIENNPAVKAAIEKDILDHTPFKQGEIVSLVKNEANTFYSFENSDDVKTGVINKQGTYELLTEAEKPYLIMKFGEGDEQQVQRYELVNSSGFSTFAKFFELDNDVMAKGEEKIVLKTSPVYDVIVLVQDVTNQYKTDYPDLSSAIREFGGTVYHPSSVALPLQLVE